MTHGGGHASLAVGMLPCGGTCWAYCPRAAPLSGHIALAHPLPMILAASLYIGGGGRLTHGAGMLPLLRVCSPAAALAGHIARAPLPFLGILPLLTRSR